MGRKAVALQASVGIPDSVDEMFVELSKHFDRLDILVSNAASGVLKPALEMTLKHWRWCLETNALALESARAARGADDAGRVLHDRAIQSRRVARDARLRIHRRIEGRARIAGAHAGAGAGPAPHSRQHGKRRRGGHRRAALFPEPRGTAGQFRASNARRPHADAGGCRGRRVPALPARGKDDHRAHAGGRRRILHFRLTQDT